MYFTEEQDPHILAKCVNVGLTRKVALLFPSSCDLFLSLSSYFLWKRVSYILITILKSMNVKHPFQFGILYRQRYWMRCVCFVYKFLHFSFEMSRIQHGKSKSDIITIPIESNWGIEMFVCMRCYQYEADMNLNAALLTVFFRFIWLRSLRLEVRRLTRFTWIRFIYDLWMRVGNWSNWTAKQWSSMGDWRGKLHISIWSDLPSIVNELRS